VFRSTTTELISGSTRTRRQGVQSNRSRTAGNWDRCRESAVCITVTSGKPPPECSRKPRPESGVSSCASAHAGRLLELLQRTISKGPRKAPRCQDRIHPITLGYFGSARRVLARDTCITNTSGNPRSLKVSPSSERSSLITTHAFNCGVRVRQAVFGSIWN